MKIVAAELGGDPNPLDVVSVLGSLRFPRYGAICPRCTGINPRSTGIFPR